MPDVTPKTESGRHSSQCFDIGGGPGHEACVCVCHGTMSARAILFDDPDWHAAACAYDAGNQECDCILPDRLDAIKQEAASKAVAEIREDALLLADAVIGGSGYKPHREAAARVRRALIASERKP